jgi:hypothetical protein
MNTNKMVKFIAFSPLIEHIIKDVVDNNKYNNVTKQVDFDIDWTNFDRMMFDNYDRFEYCVYNYKGILMDDYPLKTQPLETYLNNKPEKYKITSLSVLNTVGWNKDARCRGIAMEDDLYDYKYEDYNDLFEIKNTNITLLDIANAVFEVKSGKNDDNYELFIGACCKFNILKDKEVKLSIALDFDHGS